MPELWLDASDTEIIENSCGYLKRQISGRPLKRFLKDRLVNETFNWFESYFKRNVLLEIAGSDLQLNFEI